MGSLRRYHSGLHWRSFRNLYAARLAARESSPPLAVAEAAQSEDKDIVPDDTQPPEADKATDEQGSAP